MEAFGTLSEAVRVLQMGVSGETLGPFHFFYLVMPLKTTRSIPTSSSFAYRSFPSSSSLLCFQNPRLST
jgi:hypothetical protein